MPLSNRIAGHLPYLRRYSRALTGSQASGDAYVVATLEALIAAPSIFPAATNDRISLFKLFTHMFGSVSVELKEINSPYAWERNAELYLASIPPVARQAVLLVAVEGFSTREAAEILGLTETDLGAVLSRASAEISSQITAEIMIIEDEPLIAMDIEDMVISLGHKVTGVARTHGEAIELFGRNKPSMILADIQLADGSSGIDAVNEILDSSNVPVIFITAFPERLLTGDRPEPAFLVTKPFNPDMVKALISQALFFQDLASGNS